MSLPGGAGSSTEEEAPVAEGRGVDHAPARRQIEEPLVPPPSLETRGEDDEGERATYPQLSKDAPPPVGEGGSPNWDLTEEEAPTSPGAREADAPGGAPKLALPEGSVPTRASGADGADAMSPEHSPVR
nr:uncharacterized protein LOC109740861 [Aegilops tauschii subsp. strangulata]